MNTKIELAGIPIEINSMYDSIGRAGGDYTTESDAEFVVSIDRDDICLEREYAEKECIYEGIPYPNYSDSQLENTAIYRKIAEKLPNYDAAIIHGSAVVADGNAYLFTAKSGIGKTTHSKLWIENIPRSYILNGDKPIIRAIDGQICVCGTPWMGKEGYGCNKIVPLKAICFIRQSDTNKIEKVKFGSVITELIEQIYRPRDVNELIKTMQFIDLMGKTIPIYELNCNIDLDAAIIAYTQLSKN